MTMLDTLFDDFPFDPALRIPPLHDPFPDLSAQITRPSPLEPNARVDDSIDNGTAKLTGRRKALAEAKPLDEPSGANDLRPMQKNPRKKPKLHEHERIADFVQLPQPNAKAKNDKPPPFQPVSVLNELHEPPPSAALFPPITPKDGQSEHRRRHSTLSRSLSREASPPGSGTAEIQPNSESPSTKHTFQRGRRKWTLHETEQLIEGIEIYGIGKWKKILLHPGFSFQPGRTPVDLKDHYRTKMKSKGKDIKNEPDPRVLLALPQVNNRKGAWTAAEDAELERGYKRHGMCWTDISQDPDIQLSHKTGAQVRDRFRTKFADLYAAEARQNTDRKRSTPKKRSRKSTWTESEEANLEKGFKKHGFAWNEMLKDPDLHLGHKSGPQIRDKFRINFPMLYGEGTGETPNHGTARKNRRPPSGRSKLRAGKPTTNPTKCGNNVGSSPNAMGGAQEMNNEGDGSDHFANEGDDDTGLAEADEQITPSRPVASNFGPNNIMGLLNNDAMDDRPSSALRLDGWDANVTLPPLLWEDMATRPMFDLE